MNLSTPCRLVITLMGGWLLSPSLLTAEPAKPGLIIIQGPRPEIRRYLPAKPRPEPQDHPSGWLYPTPKTGKTTLAAKKPAATSSSQRSASPPVTQQPPSTIPPVPSVEKKREPQLSRPKSSTKSVPVAEKLREGFVKSPFAPYVPLDVQGLPSGTLAKDPVTGKLFRVP